MSILYYPVYVVVLIKMKDFMCGILLNLTIFVCRGNYRPRGGGIVGGFRSSMPNCKFFNKTGFCREGDNCRFRH